MLWKLGIWGAWVIVAALHWQLVASEWFDKKPVEVILGFFVVGALAVLVAKITGGTGPASTTVITWAIRRAHSGID